MKSLNHYSYNNQYCSSLETMLETIYEKPVDDESYIICSHHHDFLQAIKVSEERYLCEYGREGMVLQSPQLLGYEDILNLFQEFDNGVDFAFKTRNWKIINDNKVLRYAIFTAVIFIALYFILFKF